MRRWRYLLLIALAGYLLTGVARVRPEERAVVRRFGEVVAHPGPGLWVGLPYGFDRVDRVPAAQVRRVPVGGDEPFLTGDQNLVSVRVVVDYSVGESTADLEDFVAQRSRIDSVLERETEAAVGEWVAGRPVDDVLLTGNALLPAWLVRRVQERIADQRLGIRVQQATVSHLAPPDEVRSSFDDVNAAQTAVRAHAQKARQEADRLRQEAAASAYQTEQQGAASASAKRSIAKADAEAFLRRLEQYRKLKAGNPDVLTAIWWEEMGRVWMAFRGRGRVELLDAHLGPDGIDLTTVIPPPKK